jgi:hypothetical protein
MGNAGTNGQESGDFVCRVSRPSERLTSGQSWGCWLVGFSSPFVALAILSGSILSVSFMILGLFVVGLVMVFKDGIKAARGWRNNAMRAFLSGFNSCLPFLGMMLMLSMCMRR